MVDGVGICAVADVKASRDGSVVAGGTAASGESELNDVARWLEVSDRTLASGGSETEKALAKIRYEDHGSKAYFVLDFGDCRLELVAEQSQVHPRYRHRQTRDLCQQPFRALAEPAESNQ